MTLALSGQRQEGKGEMSSPTQLKSFIEMGRRACDMDLRAADFLDADLSNLSADGVDFRAADMRRATLRDARLGECRLEGARLGDADWSRATLRMCVLDGALAAGARFDNARIEDSSAKGADLTRASLHSAKLTETSFERSVLEGAVLDDAEGEGVQLRGADLRGATLIAARLDDADFRGADLSGADLSRGRFQGADFRGAILDGVQWTDTDLSGAIFDTGADPAQKPSSTPDSARPSPYEKEVEPIARWVEGFLKFSSREPDSGSEQPPPSDQSEPSDSAQIHEFLKALEKALPTQSQQGKDMLSSFQTLLEIIETAPEDEPPEALKPIIKQILGRLPNDGRNPNVAEILNALFEPASKQAAPQTQEESRFGSDSHSDIVQSEENAEKP
jgi:uncharacterized protein YjbI with pentapeptide repeats